VGIGHVVEVEGAASVKPGAIRNFSTPVSTSIAQPISIHCTAMNSTQSGIAGPIALPAKAGPQCPMNMRPSAIAPPPTISCVMIERSGRGAMISSEAELRDQRSHPFPGAALAHQPEAEIVRRDAHRVAASARVADEIGHVGSVTTFDDANAAIDHTARSRGLGARSRYRYSQTFRARSSTPFSLAPKLSIACGSLVAGLVALGLVQEEAGEVLEVLVLDRVLGRDDEAELVAIAVGPLEEGGAVGPTQPRIVKVARQPLR
jgi:hypothetical protein